LIRRLVFLLLTLLIATPATARPLAIMADASLQEAIAACADAWVGAGHERPSLSFGNSRILGERVAALAPADIFVAADSRAMQNVAQRGMLRPGSVAQLPLANRVVLIASGSGPERFTPIDGSAPLPAGRVTITPDAYGKPTLERLLLWPSVARRAIPAPHSRAAVDMVARRHADLGIVTLTDARTTRLVHIVGIFPPGSYPPFRYSVAIPATSSNAEAEQFRRFLLSRRGFAIFARFGFMPGGES